MLGYIKTIFSKSTPQDIKYQLVDIYKDNNGERVIVMKLLDSPRSTFVTNTKKLLSVQRNILSQCSIEDVLTVTGLATADSKVFIEQKTTVYYKYFAILCMLFITTLITANITASKLISVAGYTMVGGILVFPFCYIIGDIITEVYGYKRSRQVIWCSILCFVFSIGMVSLIIELPASRYWHNQREYELILGSVPRVIIASLISYVIGGFTNSYILAKMKLKVLSNSSLAKRIIISSVAGNILDTVVFIILAYIWVMPFTELLFLVIRQFILKSFIEFSLIPLTLWLIAKIKEHENLSIVDINTNFNPFSLDTEYYQENNININK